MSNIDGLDRMKEALVKLGNPEKSLKIIHVAGTNGKGSTCVMIASILEEAGFTVGLYTSPHLETERERIQLWDGAGRHMIEQGDLDHLRDRTSPDMTVFERYTAAAYMYYAEKKPDYVVLECGMGGRLDSTNTIEKPLACVITQVGLDHTDELGHTIEEVAYNKAGIIKRGVPVVSQTDDEAVRTVIKSVAKENRSEYIDVTESLAGYDYLLPAMHGSYQRKNAVTAALAVKAAGIDLPDEIIASGISKAVLPGRFEILSEDNKPKKKSTPYFIVDGAHNPDAMQALVKEYMDFSHANDIKNTAVIFGCMQDKNSERMAEILASGLDNASYLAVSIDYGRAESPQHIADLMRSYGCECKAMESTADAYTSAMESGADSILVAGSIYLAGEMRSIYKNA